MGIYKDKEVTKDGKQWFFKIRYEDIDGSKKQKRSKRYITKKEAEEAEFNFVKVYPKMTNFNNPNEIKKEMLYYTYDEFKYFLSFAKDNRIKIIYEILYFCGLRRGELIGLQWKDINFTRRTISISKQITARSGSVKTFVFCVPKTNSSIRTLPIPKTLLKSLQMLKEDAMKVNGFNDDYFVCGDAFSISSSVIRNSKKDMAKQANLKEIRTHDFRHSCASLLIDKGANITMVAKYLGHTKIEETLNTYSHMFTNTMTGIVDTFDSLEIEEN